MTMMNTVALAKASGVAAGAHPGLPDLLGFGRRVMNVTTDDVYSYVAYQVGALKAFLMAQGMRMNHVKPHGAMFHLMRNSTTPRPRLMQSWIRSHRRRFIGRADGPRAG